MKPDNLHDRVWARLTDAARRAPPASDAAAPHGFATRVAALALAGERAGHSLFERFALRAVGVASLLAVASVLANFSALSTWPAEDEPIVAGEDLVKVLLTESE